MSVEGRDSVPDDGGLGVDTKVTRAGRNPAAQSGAVNAPVYRASTIIFDRVDDLERAKAARFTDGTVFYGRMGTPDVFAFASAIAELEGGDAAIAVPSGLAACMLPLVAFLKTGDHVLVTDSVYEPVRTNLSDYLAGLGIETTYYDPTIGAGIETLIRDNTRLVYTESPGSLTFDVQDIPAIAAAAHRRGALVVADNTWASPVFHNPLALGADIVVHAGTKYLVGHSDAMLGVVVCRAEHSDRLRRAANWLGYRAPPDDVYLAARGLRTLAVRMRRHYESGLAIARWLAARPEVRRVLHPGLADHPGHALWQRDFSGASGLFSIVLETHTKEKAIAFVEALRLFGLGFSWGGYESLALISDPHHARTATAWNEEGIVVRLHVGLEDPDDLVRDLEAALGLLGDGR